MLMCGLFPKRSSLKGASTMVEPKKVQVVEVKNRKKNRGCNLCFLGGLFVLTLSTTIL